MTGTSGQSLIRACTSAVARLMASSGRNGARRTWRNDGELVTVALGTGGGQHEEVGVLGVCSLEQLSHGLREGLSRGAGRYLVVAVEN